MPTIRLDVQGNGFGVFQQVFSMQKRMEEGELRIVAAAKLRQQAMASGGGGGGLAGVAHAMSPSVIPGPGSSGFGGLHIPEGHNPHGHGGHHGWWHSVHGAGRAVGGEFGHMAHRGSALAGLASTGIVGAGIGAVGLGLNLLVASFEHFAEAAKEAAERVDSYGDKLAEAAESRGRSGLETAKSEGAGLRQVQNLGLMDAFKKARASGLDISASNFAALGGSDFRLGAVREAVSLGLSGDSASELASHLSFNGKDANRAGWQIAQQGENRFISNREYLQAAHNTSHDAMTRDLNKISSFQGMTANVGVDSISEGVGTAGKQYGQALDPVGAAKAELQRDSERKAAVFDQVSKAAGWFSEAVRNAAGRLGMGEGSFAQQARAERDANAAGMSGN